MKTEADALIAFVRARLAEPAPLDAAMAAAWPGLPAGISLDEARRRTAAALAAAGIDSGNLVLRQTLDLYEDATDEVAAECYLTVIRLHAARWDGHADYQQGFRLDRFGLPV